MRPDMHKVIVERPRRGSRGPFRRPPGEKHGRVEDLPAAEGVRRPHQLSGQSRELNEHLAPLQRYLRKQVGRPWDNVYSEISRHLAPTSAVKQHVRDHIWDYVERHVTLGPDGAVYMKPGRFNRPEAPLAPGTLFIHPVHGLLTVAQAPRRGQGRSR